MRLVEIVDPVRKIILHWPIEAKQEVGAILLRLQSGGQSECQTLGRCQLLVKACRKCG
jgi:hypothetical protein